MKIPDYITATRVSRRTDANQVWNADRYRVSERAGDRPMRTEESLGLSSIQWRFKMTMPYERTRAILGTEEILRELLDSSKHPETTAETRRDIKWALRHYPERHNIDNIARECPDELSRTDAPEIKQWESYR